MDDPGRARQERARAHAAAAAARVEIINSAPHIAGRDYLFGMRGQGFKSWGDGKAELDKRLGDTVAPFVLHDIRRSVATGMADLGVQPHIIETILNHQSGHKRGVAGVYNRVDYDREVKAALAMWADYVRALAEGGERKVLAFNFAKGGQLTPQTDMP